MLNIDHKISPLPIRCYFTFAELQQRTADFSKVLHQRCAIYWQSKCQISVKSASANNYSYSGFCEVTPLSITLRHKNLKLKCFGVPSQKPL